MILAVSGTRYGLTAKQHDAAFAALRKIKPTGVRHGCALGADEEFVFLCFALRPRPRVEAFPSTFENWTSADALALSDAQAKPAEALARNRTIVTGAARLLAAPAEMEDPGKGGTWYSIKFARGLGVPTTVILPDGSVVGDPLT